MNERLLRELRSAIRETIAAKHLGLAEEWILTGGGAAPEVEQAFLESVADRLEGRLNGSALRPASIPRALLN